MYTKSSMVCISGLLGIATLVFTGFWVALIYWISSSTDSFTIANKITPWVVSPSAPPALRSPYSDLLRAQDGILILIKLVRL